MRALGSDEGRDKGWNRYKGSMGVWFVNQGYCVFSGEAEQGKKKEAQAFIDCRSRWW